MSNYRCTFVTNFKKSREKLFIKNQLTVVLSKNIFGVWIWMEPLLPLARGNYQYVNYKRKNNFIMTS